MGDPGAATGQTEFLSPVLSVNYCARARARVSVCVPMSVCLCVEMWAPGFACPGVRKWGDQGPRLSRQAL